MKKKTQPIKEKTKEELQQEGLWYKEEEIERLVEGVKDIGFEVVSEEKDKDFNKENVKESLSFKHKRSGIIFTIERRETIVCKVDLMKDSVTDIMITLMFKYIEDVNEEYGDDF